MGIGAGDTVLVRAALRAMGPVEGGSAAKLLIDALLELVGPEGTIAGLAFTGGFLWLRKHRDYVFDPATTLPTSGGLAVAMVKHPSAVRSTHPSNSFVAIGRHAAELMAGHDDTAPCFFPMAAMLRRDAKMLLVGCLDSSPGFSTAHWARHELGLTVRNILRGRWRVYYRKNGETKVFKIDDIAGCSQGFRHFYGHYVEAGKLATGFVGQAYSASIDARAAYDIERAELEKNPRISLCDRPSCYSCRTTWYFNKRDWPGFWVRYLPRMIRALRKL